VKISMKALIYLSIALIIIISMLFIKKSYYLELRSDENKLYMSKKINLGDEFSVKFIHSVNKSPVIDYYIIKEDGIYVTKTKYYDFGAGVQTQLEEGQKLDYTEDGAMLISGFDKKISNLAYVVGKVSDHELQINNEIYSLRKICGKASYVNFKLIKKWSF
jgi:hypothetical protein